MSYDSKSDTLEHIMNVNRLLHSVVRVLLVRADTHDESKLGEIEKPTFDLLTPRLSAVTYGSHEYKQMLEDMRPVIEHHNRVNRHHPEHHKNGINDMTLIDIVEMLCDWKAASMRHEDGDIFKSIEVNRVRHELSDQLASIFKNTIKTLGWLK